MLLKSQDFLVKLRAIKHHFDIELHPIRQFIERFKQIFIEQNRLLLYERSLKNPRAELTEFDQFQQEINRCIRDLKVLRGVVQDVIVRFYELEFTGVNDMNIQLLQNLVSSFIMSGELYIFMQCLYTLHYQEEIKALNAIFEKKSTPLSQIFDIEKQNIKDEFKLNFEEEVKKSIFKHPELQERFVSLKE
mmetsp:Transcript_9427/g.14434  ORF Transcript_9427/g.14434 Transcript_9427/m.14434 type:complete len:190 (+) Transcript_9427:1289-1858(+)